jgi:hypothetical protein
VGGFWILIRFAMTKNIIQANSDRLQAKNCRKCDELDAFLERLRTERSKRLREGTLTPESELELEAEEIAVFRASQDHKIADHHADGK